MELKDEQLTTEQFLALLQQYPVVRNSDYAPEGLYPVAPPAAKKSSAPALTKDDAVNSDQAFLLEQTLKEFSKEDQHIRTAGKDFYTELSLLVMRYMSPGDVERFIQSFREEHDLYIDSLSPLEARKLREDFAKKP